MADDNQQVDDQENQRVGKRQKLSVVWDHFRLRRKENLVVCFHCNTELAYHNSTSSMLQHLSRKHPEHISASERPTTSQPKQGAIEKFLVRGPTCTPTQAAILSDSILNMLVTDMCPMSMVGDVGFKKMIATFHPNYELPSRTFFTQQLENKYEHVKTKMEEALQEVDSITLTTDIWTSVATEAYMGVTCHYISSWKLVSHCLTTMPLEERHTAANIADWIMDVIAKFKIPPQKIKAVVHDNGANVVAAVKILNDKHGWASVKCAGHTLNLVVQSSLKDQPAISKCVAAARCLVEHFKKSELACTKLKVKQKQMTKENMLVQDVCTRWNSTFAMLSRLKEQRWPVTATLSDPEVSHRGKHYLDLKTEQWCMIEELILEPFNSATEFMSGEKYVTLSALPHVVNRILKKMESQGVESPAVKSFQAHAKEQVTKRWKGLNEFKPESPSPTLLAAALDPRYLRLKFLPAEIAFSVKATVQTMALAVKQQMGARVNEESSPRERSPGARSSLKTSFLDSDSNSSDEDDEGQLSNEATQNEVLMYFREQPLSKMENPLVWWRMNEPHFPTVAKLARSLLCIPGTSTPSERLFSAAGNIASKRRASLSPEHVDMLTFLHCNHMLLE